jgi:F-box domain
MNDERSLLFAVLHLWFNFGWDSASAGIEIYFLAPVWLRFGFQKGFLKSQLMRGNILLRRLRQQFVARARNPTVDRRRGLTSLEDFPNEIIHAVIEYLGASDIAALRGVNVRLKVIF